MKPITVRDLKIGEGIPKVCVPIVEVTREEIILKAQKILRFQADMVEWRVDWYEDSGSVEQVITTAAKLREVLGDKPLLFTYRTREEGGEGDISLEEYKKMNLAAAVSGFVDLVDIEAFINKVYVEDMVERIHQEDVKVIASSHDFKETPKKEELIRLYLYMQRLGADIIKIAVTPRTKSDVLTLLSASVDILEKYAKTPIITMSMGKDGMISRISGEIFGSSVTFGSIDKASAPGQIAVTDLQEVLQIIHGK